MYYPKTSEYQIRFVELHGLRSIYMPQIYERLHTWSKTMRPWIEDIEDAFEWMVEEAIHKLYRCKVISHFHSDFGEFLYDHLPDFNNNVANVMEFMKIESNDPIHIGEIKHIKVSVLGNIAIVGILYR
jgi:hypothetical protein